MALLRSAIPASWDGQTLEIVFPPGWKSNVQKVQSLEPAFQEAFVDVFGVSPRLVCLAREPVPDLILSDEDEDQSPVTAEDAIARLKAQLGAEPEG